MATVVTGVALLAIGSVLLALSGLPQPVPASMMSIGGIFLIAPLLIKRPPPLIKEREEREKPDSPRPLTVKLTSQKGCALGRGLEFLPPRLTGIERIDGKEWKEPEEMIVKCEVSGHPAFTHLPLCLFRNEKGSPKSFGETISFVYEGRQYDCTFGEGFEISKLVYLPTCTLPRALGDLDVSAFLGPIFSGKRECFPDPRTLTSFITGTIRVKEDVEGIFFRGELPLELMHGEGWDWRRPNEIFVGVKIEPEASISRLPLSFFIEEGDDLRPKKNGADIRFYHSTDEYSVRKYILTLDQGKVFESVYFKIKIPEGDLPDPRQQAMYNRHLIQAIDSVTDGKISRKHLRNLKQPLIRPFVLPGYPYRGEVPFYSGKCELIYGEKHVALVASADPKEELIKWKSLTIPNKEFPQTWLLVVDLPTPTAKAKVTWKGTMFTLTVENVPGTP